MIICDVCPNYCPLAPDTTGICGTRTVQDGYVVSLSYGQATSIALDNIEKKPLKHFRPGSMILSYGSYGCNLSCEFCQNSDISQVETCTSVKTRFITPALLVEKALEVEWRGNIGIAYTYNEPLIAPEFLIETAKIAQDRGLVNVVVTNGYTSEKTMHSVLKYVDAFNIDLKCYSEEGYRGLGAPNGLEVVKRSITMAVEAGAHVEVTTLVVPGLSDDPYQFKEECKWLASLDPEIPLHLSRFFPAHRSNAKEPTSRETLERFRVIAENYLTHIHFGNI